MIILGIDTSQSASVALVDTDTGSIIAAAQADDQRRHVEFIGPALADVLASDVRPELVVVGIGPGPFTGLRVGIAAGIAVGQARGIPVRGLLSQHAIAEEFVRRAEGSSAPASEVSATAGNESGRPVLIASDARRKEVYFSVYESADATLSAGPFVAKPAEVASVLADNGFRLEMTEEKLGRGFLLYPDILGASSAESITDPRAEYLALAAAREIAGGGELSEPIPEYLREPDAKATPVRESSLR
ncbi:tRNA (adenosine(37)-N6)-threonylcarbamoyltransferase complex dimerization subunit type 1 TsaB [Brevibacterium permense]|uniref:tRNA (adenosine(37)-N6)-threonylcarbamoyltransferase complex dimerization subunit type 1 TsaB n=1 Tax=Brevibacterium permense TaxID=234834 RepID=UPI0021D2CA48|nr:tRNA (adenosine(37)-N6)-threonylcarbamoyltransferase complex dimerization subunit type 1 TsaB [Brevibacterium permense]MCU4296806.1 tRNA (adenosine(37)-N6)-threonylcarbamoyltransferase complex dimerization subunit type 1 TsaB [Brevibacterium permense]